MKTPGRAVYIFSGYEDSEEGKKLCSCDHKYENNKKVRNLGQGISSLQYCEKDLRLETSKVNVEWP